MHVRLLEGTKWKSVDPFVDKLDLKDRQHIFSLGWWVYNDAQRFAALYWFLVRCIMIPFGRSARQSREFGSRREQECDPPHAKTF